MTLYRICRQFKDAAGIGLDPTGLCIHATDAEAAVARARQLMPSLPKNLVAIPEQN